MYLVTHPEVSGRSKRSAEDFVNRLKLDSRVNTTATLSYELKEFDVLERVLYVLEQNEPYISMNKGRFWLMTLVL